MAVTQNTYTGNGSTTNYAFTFPYLAQTDVKVKLDGVTQATTEYTFPNATTVAMDTAPANGVTILIFRDTNNDNKQATFYPGSAIKAEDLNNNYDQILYTAQEVDNYAMTTLGDDEMIGDFKMGSNKIIFEGATADAYETSLTVADPTADRTITLPNVSGNIVTTGDTGTVTATMLAANSVDSSELVDGSVDLSHMSANSVDSDQYVDGSIDHVHLANDSIDGDNIQDDVINSEHIAAGAVDLEHMSANSVDSDQYVDGSIDRVHLETDIIDGTKLADNAVNSEHITAGSIDLAHMSVNSIDSDQYVDGSIDTAHIADTAVTTDKISNDAINSTKISDNAIDSEHYVDGSIDRVHLSADIIDATKIEDNAVTTDHIADAELTTLAGMQSGTASILAGGTALTSTLTELNQLDGKTIGETTLTTNSDTAIPTSKAVNDRILTVTNALGGFVAIADKDNFPTSNPDPSDGAGTVVSISNAAGISVNSSGVGSLATRAGGSDAVIINGFPSALRGGATVGSATNANPYILPSSVGLQVQTTTTAHTYDYHKYLINEEDANKLSGDIQDFQERYRVASSAPTSSKDDGDLWFDTTNNKMKVYNASGSSWDDVAAPGNFFINTISSSSGTGGGSATFNGTAYRFTLSSPPSQGAQQLIISINGVIQKPNSGTSQPAEGFAVDTNDVIFSAAPPSGSDYFIITLGNTVNIGTPSDNTVATAKIQNLAVTTDKIAADAVTGAKIADDAVGAEHIEDLDANVKWVDNSKAAFGTGSDFEIYHDGTNNYLVSGTGLIRLRHSSDDAIITNPNGGVELYYDNSKKFETSSVGATVNGRLTVDGNLISYTAANNSLGLSGHRWNDLFISNDIDLLDNSVLLIGTGNDLNIWHDGSNSNIENQTGQLRIRGSYIFLRSQDAQETHAQFTVNGACELFYDDSKKFETKSTGVEIHGHLITGDSNEIQIGNSGDLKLYHDGSNSYIKNATGDLAIESAGDVVLRTASSENSIKCLDNSGVELYFDNSIKVETRAGDTLFHDDIRIQDNNKINIGTGDDLQIYHDGTSSIIENATGNLAIRGKTGENHIVMIPDSKTALYYDNTKKFETNSAGTKVFGNGYISEGTIYLEKSGAHHHRILANDTGNDLAFQQSSDTGANSNFTTYLRIDDGGDISLPVDSQKLLIGAGDDLQMYHNGSHSYIDSNTGTLYIRHSGEYGAAFIKDGGVDLYFNNNRQFATYSEGIYSKTHIPFDDDTYHLGGSSYRWDNIWGTSGTVNTSDRNTKNTIVTSDLGLPFINKLKPVSYKFNGKTRTHYGLIAQDIETTLSDISKSTTDFGGFVKDKGKDGEDVYALRYTEFIAPLIKAVQELSAENDSLKARLTTLETKVAALEAS